MCGDLFLGRSRTGRGQNRQAEHILHVFHGLVEPDQAAEQPGAHQRFQRVAEGNRAAVPRGALVVAFGMAC